MANYYSEFSTVLPMPEEKATQLASLLGKSDLCLPEHVVAEPHGLWLAGHEGLEDDVVDLISAWLFENLPDFEPLVITFANYCSKLRVDAQNGSALRLSPGKAEYGTMKFA